MDPTSTSFIVNILTVVTGVLVVVVKQHYDHRKHKDSIQSDREKMYTEMSQRLSLDQQNRIDDLEEKVSKSSDAYAEVKQQTGVLKGQVGTLTERLEIEMQRAVKLESSKKKLETEITHLRSRIQELQRVHDENVKRIEALEEELTKKIDKIERLEHELHVISVKKDLMEQELRQINQLHGISIVSLSDEITDADEEDDA